MALVETDLPFLGRNAEIKSASDLNPTTVRDTEIHDSEKIGTPFELEEHPVDEVRPIKVGIIGAGMAGIIAGMILPAKLPGLDLRIYEKNADVGGTW